MPALQLQARPGAQQAARPAVLLVRHGGLAGGAAALGRLSGRWAEGGGILCRLVVGHHFPSRKNNSRDCLRRAVRHKGAGDAFLEF